MQVFWCATLAVAVLAGAENELKSGLFSHGQCVRLLPDVVAFLSSFDRFDDELNGLTEAKLQRTGQKAIVVNVWDDRTMTCEFRDRTRLDFPWESAESTVSCDFLTEREQPIAHTHVPLVNGDAGRDAKEASETDISGLRTMATEGLGAPVAETPATHAHINAGTGSYIDWEVPGASLLGLMASAG